MTNLRCATKPLIAALNAVIFLTLASSAFSQGQLAPTAAPTPTMKSLDQIEPRRPLVAGTAGVAIGASGTITISQSGSYYLTGNLTVTSGNGITITSNEVTLDLGGFTISSTGTGGHGVSLPGGVGRISISNGHIKGNYVYSGGAFTGSGLGSGIDYPGVNPLAIRIKDITVDGVSGYGIDLGTNEASVVESCVVRIAGTLGIRAGIILDSAALITGGIPLTATTAINSIGRRADDTQPTSSPSSPQADQRVAISSLPYTISQPGSYYLTKNLTVATGDGVTIASPNVTVDLNGFTISSTSPSYSGSGVNVGSGNFNATIYNGNITGTTTVSGSTFSGGGFNNGIFAAGESVVIKNVKISGVGRGIECLPNTGSLVEECTARICSFSGIVADVVRGSSARACGSYGIYCQAASDSLGEAVGIAGGDAFYGVKLVDGCVGIATGNCGGIHGNGTVSNSNGTAVSGRGIDAPTVTNSRASSTSSEGIYGATVANCYGTTQNGDGISATVVINSFGVTTSASFVGLRAFTANGSRGTGPGGVVSQSITNKYNMP